MPLSQIVYVSRASAQLDREALPEIVSRSAKRNAARQVTGILLACGKQFMQLLEGEPETLDSLFKTISADPRHEEVQLLMRKQVQKRLYPEWAMELIDLRGGAKLDRSRLLSLINELRARYDTDRYSAEARMLLNDFRQQLAV